MKLTALHDFIVKPVGDRYNNKITIDGSELIINTSLDSFKSVNNIAEVVSTPLFHKTDIKVGDIIIIHHNVFRRFYDIRNNQKNSRAYINEDLYFAQLDQIYLYNQDGKWRSFGDRCFVAPITNTDQFSTQKEQKLIGILKYGNSSLEALKITPGDVVGFTPNSEYDFIINKQRLYCIKSNDIVLKYGHEREATEYNPGWAKSS